MNLRRRRQREWSDLAVDRQAPYMVGRLLGANEMAVALLSQSDESKNAQHIAEVLERMLPFFMQEITDEAVTEVRRPLPA